MHHKWTWLVGATFGLMTPMTSAADTYAPWLTQIGLNDRVLSAANWGRGMWLGVVDTGITSTASVFAKGQVSTQLSGCAAVSFKCSKGFQDDQGHGTAVAAIAAGFQKATFNSQYGGYKVSVGNVMSVAPDANLIAEKVLNAAGTGYSTDVASGIKKAADAGAAVINISITYGNGADIVAAMNYAAAKGAMLVWAGGNQAQALLNGANTNGLSTAAIQRLLFVGSVNNNNVLSRFSNTAGNGSLVATNGATTRYMQRWIMAPGESILAPNVLAGPNAWAYWSGTSMSAPLVSGALVLLESAWPILKTNGTAANLLLATSTDLGAAKVDANYGNGLVNVAKAFEPYGALTVSGTGGKSYSVTQLTGSLLSSGVLGKLSGLQTRLANYTAFDGYARNFTVNLSGLVRSPAAAALLNPLPSNARKGPVVVKLAEGDEFSYWQQTLDLNPTDLSGLPSAALQTSQTQGFAMFKQADGTAIATGIGYAPQYAQQYALLNNPEAAWWSLDVGRVGLTSLSQGGAMLSVGLPIAAHSRLSWSWSQSAERNPLQDQATLHAQQWSVGWSHQPSSAWTLAASLHQLQEQSGFLGTYANADNGLGMRGQAATAAIEFDAVYQPSAKHAWLAQLHLAKTNALDGNGLLAGTSDLYAQGFAIGWLGKSLWKPEDKLTLTLQQPLRLSAGSVGLRVAGVDAQGLPNYQTENISLVPSGREIDLKLNYDLPLSATRQLSAQAAYRQDFMQIEGLNDASIGMTYQQQF